MSNCVLKNYSETSCCKPKKQKKLHHEAVFETYEGSCQASIMALFSQNVPIIDF